MDMGRWVKLKLEGDIVVSDAGIGVVRLACAGRCALVEPSGIRLRRTTTRAAAFAGFAAPADGHVVDDDLRAVSLLAGLFIVPGAVGDFALDKELRALLYVIFSRFSQLVQEDEIMPFALINQVGLGIFCAIRGGE